MKKILFSLFGLAMSATAAFADAASGPKDVRNIDIISTEFIFAPNHISLQKGTPVQFHIYNKGNVMHEFVSTLLANVDAEVEVNGVILEGKLDEIEIPAGKDIILAFTPEKEGVYEYVCEMKDHHGMKGTIEIK